MREYGMKDPHVGLKLHSFKKIEEDEICSLLKKFESLNLKELHSISGPLKRI